MRKLEDVLKDIKSKDKILACEVENHIKEIIGMISNKTEIEQCPYCNHWKMTGYICDCELE